MMKLLIGGSPCTHWSIAQTKNRETEPSGLGWELFLNYKVARDKYQPDYFLYENNKSMAAAIRAKITEELGVEPVLINSSLVSAQNRQRLYWVGKRNPDGTYSQVDIAQPEDRGILLRDILETGACWREKAYSLTASAHSATAEDMIARRQRNGVAEPFRIEEIGIHKNCDVVTTDSSIRLQRRDAKHSTVQGSHINFTHGKAQTLSPSHITRIAEPVNITAGGKSQCLRATYYKDGIRNMVGNTVDRKTCVAVPIRVGTIENDAKNQDNDSQQYRVYSPDGKSVTLCGNGGGLGAKTGLYATPITPPMRVREATQKGYVDILPGECVDLSMPNSKTRRGRAMKNKSNCLTTSCEYYEYCGTLDCPIYQVKDGYITIKGKEYPIKLRDGCYIIRKLTVTECKRLQTVPDEYAFPVSSSQAYKMLGNGWTVDVIAHIMSHFDGLTTEPVEVLSMYDGMSCGHIALDKLGAQVTAYYATEIDKYAIQTTQANFPETVQMGDAFQVRDQGWRIPPLKENKEN